MATYQFQIAQAGAQAYDPKGWRSLQASSIEEAIQGALDTLHLSDLPCDVLIVTPGAPRYDNGAPAVVQAFTIARKENA